MFCGIGSTLKVIKAFKIEFENNEIKEYLPNQTCIVEDIIGYGYNLKAENDQNIFRINNGSMKDNFEIIDKIECDEDTYDNISELPLITFKKNFEIKDVVKIATGEIYRHELDKSDKIFHNIYSNEEKRIILRMKDEEFKEYIK